MNQFKEAMQLANTLLNENFRDDDVIQFVLDLILEIKSSFKENWESDWKNEIFLVNIFSILCRYGDEYDCYKRVLKKLPDPPDSLLLRLAGGVHTPDQVSSLEESEQYLARALNKKITFEAAMMMRGLSREKNQPSQESYWDDMMKDLQEKNIHTDSMIPDILRSL